MAELLDLNTELLLQQGQEMMSLRAAYENLFQHVSADLNGMNGSWSELLSHNFAGKINGAQRSFMGALGMMDKSARSAMSVAEAMQELDTQWGSRIGGALGTDPRVMNKILSKVLKEDLPEDMADAQALLAWKEKMKDQLSSSQKAWLEYLSGKALGGVEDPLKIAEYIINGEYEEAAKELGEVGLEEYIKYSLGPEAGLEADYLLDVCKNIISGGSEFYDDPSLEHALKMVWGMTGGAALETAGGKIEDVIKLIPGISEYYYDENGAEEGGDIFNVALGDIVYALTGDDERRDYFRNYCKDHGGMFDSWVYSAKEVGSFFKDASENDAMMDIFWKNAREEVSFVVTESWKTGGMLMGKAGEVISDVGDFIYESDDPLRDTAEVVGNWGREKVEDGYDALKDLGERLWHAAWE